LCLPADRRALASWLAAPYGGVAAGWARWGPGVLAWLKEARPALAAVVVAAGEDVAAFWGRFFG